MEKLLREQKWALNGALFAVAIIWGFGTIMIQIAIDCGFSTLMINLLRFIIGAVCVGAFVLKDLKKLNRHYLVLGLLCGTLLFFGFFLLQLGLIYTKPSNSLFLSSCSVICVPFISWLLMRRRPDARVFRGAVFCLIGVAVLSLEFSGGLSFSAGDLLTLGSCLVFSTHTSLMGKYSAGLESMLFTFVQLSTAALWSVAALPFFPIDYSPLWSSWQGTLAVVLLGVLNTGLCYIIQITSQKYASATKVSMILGLEAVFGSVCSVLIGFEPLTWRLVVGGLIMMLSVFYIENDLSALFHRKGTPAA
ncbi:MAG: DMT family transporter [Oscillospiraceae bacterium]|nr:DMT family transporter [Oscillospiraceae bacterium]